MRERKRENDRERERSFGAREKRDRVRHPVRYKENLGGIKKQSPKSFIR